MHSRLMQFPTGLRSLGRWCLLGLLCLTAIALQPGAAQQAALNAKPATSSPTPGPTATPTPSPAPNPATSLAATPAPAWKPGDFAFTQPQFEAVGDTESLHAGVVEALAQDAQGFLWIGTQKGLVRYDGYRFKRFTHRQHDAHSLAGDFVQTLCAAADGRLWVGTSSDGISVFDPKTEQFDNFQHDAKRPESVVGGTVFAFAEDASGGMWIATRLGLDFVAARAKAFQHFQHDAANPGSLLSNRVRAMVMDRRGSLWVGTDQGLQRRPSNSSQFDVVGDTGDGTVLHQNTLRGKRIVALFEAEDGKVWIGTSKHGAAYLEPSSTVPVWLPLDPKAGNPVVHTALGQAWISSIGQASVDHIWLATVGGGIEVVSAHDGTVLQALRKQAAVPASLTDDTVDALLRDKSGAMWVGTLAGGLLRNNGGSGFVRMLRQIPASPFGLATPDVRSMAELPNGQLLFCTTGGGIEILDRVHGKIARPDQTRPDQTRAWVAYRTQRFLPRWREPMPSGLARKRARWYARA